MQARQTFRFSIYLFIYKINKIPFSPYSNFPKLSIPKTVYFEDIMYQCSIETKICRLLLKRKDSESHRKISLYGLQFYN